MRIYYLLVNVIFNTTKLYTYRLKDEKDLFADQKWELG